MKKNILILLGFLFAFTLVGLIAQSPKVAQEVKSDFTKELSNKETLNHDDFKIIGIHKKLDLSCKDCHKEEKESDYNANVMGACLSCHKSYETIAEATGHLGHNNNPHASPHFENLACDLCHKAHTPTRNLCLQCHGQQTMKNLVVR